ncbi:putative CXXCH cytochrome family protein [Flavobacterium nitrogenifigens]|uniref:CXXCH cytochrome family protein n=2 Tax=Flavobacterium TaxID=237 RepID=A0ABR6Q740_9FLAO|nr:MULTISPECIES: cytochrome c3 family protein [Flavobacterium]MBB4801217.1 putative CXXCH cytochrome family protein [Flavobacterium nitrogenifigens]MBB6385035.1 putative CXXCH cytochrome family protein [Flavobacterium notoginsengisoli]
MKKAVFLLTNILLTIFFVSCNNKSEEYIDPRGTDFAGSESCVQCHKTQSDMVFQSSHFKATAPAILGNVAGDFDSKNHTFIYDKNTKLVMEKHGDSLYQVLYKNGKENSRYKFEIVFGTKHAQTSVYWKDNNTYELPLSFYHSINNWATSPGFPADKPYFDRMVVKDCYACHSSNVSSRMVDQSSAEKNFMSMDVEDIINKKTIVYGIDCERCHGPAKKHVEFHLKNPNVKVANSITSFKTLNRQQKLDACALCHSGNDGMKLRSRFEFKPGDNLSEFFRENRNITDSAKFDVHGNQFRLMAQSKCFIKSEKMDCITCHNPHENASKNMASYSKICMSCHQGLKHNETTQKTMPEKLLASNCVECHMPKKASNAISFQLSNSKQLSNYILRTHRIGIYPNAKK